MPSRPILHAYRKIVAPSSSVCWLSTMPKAPLAHEPSQPLLAFAQGHVPEVLAFELQEVECIQRGRCDDAAAVQRDGAALKEPLASEPWLPLNRSNVSL